MNRNILAIGAHPDDIELGCAGTLAKHIEQGDNILCLVMTKGENGKHSVDQAECIKSLTDLGIRSTNIIFGNSMDGYVKDDLATVEMIEHIINANNITRVYTHSGQDRHQDHRSTSAAVAAAARRIPDIMLFEGPSTSASFEPHYIIELEERHITKKLESLKTYQSQIAKGSVNLKFISSLAQMNGERFHSPYAEAFALNHSIRKGDDV